MHAITLSGAACLPQGTGDVLAELAAQAAASLQQGFSFDGNHTGVSAGPAAGRHTSVTVSFDRIAPCLLPEQKQVGQEAGGPGLVGTRCA